MAAEMRLTRSLRVLAILVTLCKEEFKYVYVLGNIKKIKENKSKDGAEVFSCVLKLPPGFYGNAEANYSDASFTVNSCSVTIKPLTVPFFFFFFGGIFEDDSKV